MLHAVCWMLLLSPVAGGEFRQEETVGRGEAGTFKSPGFPSCCDDVTEATYTLRYDGDRPIYGLALLFDDLDIAPDGSVQVNSVDGTVWASTLPRYLVSSPGWTRPFIVLPGSDLLLTVKFGTSQDFNTPYVGFKATYWPLVSEPEDDVPYTDCPAVGDVESGGTVTVSTAGNRPDGKYYRYNCVWQLKPPTDPAMKVRLNVGPATDFSDGYAVVRAGTDSESGELLKEYDYADEAMRSTYESNSGFYIALDKPTDTGTFTFSYDVIPTVDN